jgi:anti-sigma factor RsiW
VTSTRAGDGERQESMATCKECIDVLYDYIEGTLEPDLTHRLDEHFGECPPCMAFVATYRSVPTLSRSALVEDIREIPTEVKQRLKDALRRAREPQNG